MKKLLTIFSAIALTAMVACGSKTEEKSCDTKAAVETTCPSQGECSKGECDGTGKGECGKGECDGTGNCGNGGECSKGECDGTGKGECGNGGCGNGGCHK